MLKEKAVLLRLVRISVPLTLLLAAALLLGLGLGSTTLSPGQLLDAFREPEGMTATILFRLRLPRVLTAALVGAALSLGGLVFQAILRNPLAEPYILGISGGAAIGAIIGILLGLATFPGVSLLAFLGSMGTLLLVLVISSGQAALKRDSMLLSGVMVNAFCSAVIMFLISLSSNFKLHSIMFWLMGDLSSADMGRVTLLAIVLIPCFLLVFTFSHPMNLLLMGKEMALSMGVNAWGITLLLLVTCSFMVSATVATCGLLGFVGLVIPHLLRMALGPDHRILVPACLLGGAAYMVVCDMLSRVIPRQGEMPVGVITAMIGAPLFIFLLKRSHR